MLALVLGLTSCGSGDREGAHDTRVDQVPVEQLAGRLVHSQTEYDIGMPHLTSWYVVRDNQGRLGRKWVPDTNTWYCLFTTTADVYQLPSAWMDQQLPVAAQPATCNDRVR